MRDIQIKIKDKQRILVLSNEGSREICLIITHILKNVHKDHDYILSNGDEKISDAPIVIIEGNDEKVNGKARFLDYHHHVAVIHHIEGRFPDTYQSVEEYFKQFELLSSQTPKGGTLLFNKEDNLATAIGHQEREDVRLIEFSELEGKTSNNGFVTKTGITILTQNRNFASQAGAAFGLLKRLGVTENQFMDALKTINQL